MAGDTDPDCLVVMILSASDRAMIPSGRLTWNLIDMNTGTRLAGVTEHDWCVTSVHDCTVSHNDPEWRHLSMNAIAGYKHFSLKTMFVEWGGEVQHRSANL